MSKASTKPIPLVDRLKTIKEYHIMGKSDALSRAFVTKAIEEAIEHVEQLDMVKL